MLWWWQHIPRTKQHSQCFSLLCPSPQGDVSCSSPVPHTEGALTTYTARCHKENFCAFAEEHQPIDIFLEVIDEVEYENYTASFFIRDISE